MNHPRRLPIVTMKKHLLQSTNQTEGGDQPFSSIKDTTVAIVIFLIPYLRLVALWWLVVCTHDLIRWGEEWNDAWEEASNFTRPYIITVSILTVAVWHYVLMEFPPRLAFASSILVFLLMQIFMLVLSMVRL